MKGFIVRLIDGIEVFEEGEHSNNNNNNPPLKERINVTFFKEGL